MAEAIISGRGGWIFKQIIENGGVGGGSDAGPLVIPGFSTAIVTIKDSDGNPIPNGYITCNVGKVGMSANRAGQAQFIVNSNTNQCTFTGWNVSVKDNCRYVDQITVTTSAKSIPRSDVSYHDIILNRATDVRYTLPYNENNSTNQNFNITGLSAYEAYPRFQFLVANTISNLVMSGGGGGGFGSDWVIPFGNTSIYNTDSVATGGGGGDVTAILNENITVSRRSIMTNIWIGRGGSGGGCNGLGSAQNKYNNFIANNDIRWYTGLSGGTTTFLGYTAEGGTGGCFKNGGIGGNNGRGGNGADYHTKAGNGFLNLGGGGGGSCKYPTAGSPGGGAGGWNKPRENNNTAWNVSGIQAYPGYNGGGGGGGGGHHHYNNGLDGGRAYGHSWWLNGSNGGNGFIQFTIDP